MLSKSAHVGFAKAATLKRVRAVLNLAQMIFGTWTRRSGSKDPSLRSQLLEDLIPSEMITAYAILKKADNLARVDDTLKGEGAD